MSTQIASPKTITILSDSQEVKRCVYCNKQFISYKKKKRKFCSISCANKYDYSIGIKKGFQKLHKTFDGSEKGWFTTERVSKEKNVNWVDGHKMYRTWALKYYGEICAECGSLNNLEVHHKDVDRTNNKLNNLQVLCRTCHRARHRNLKLGR